MRWIALSVCILGTFLLFFFLTFLPYEPRLGLETEVTHTRIAISGLVTEESMRGTQQVLVINDTQIQCACKESYLGREVVVEGTIEEYRKRRYVQALRIYPVS